MVARLRVWIPWALGLALAVLIVSGYFRPSGSADAGPEALAGKIAPSFDISTPDGKTGSLAQYRGRVVVLNLWASWCPPCRAEMPDLQRLYRTYRSRGVVVLGVDQGESPSRAKSFAISLGIAYPILVDDRQSYGRVYAALGLPTTIFVDRRGIVVRGFDGPLTYEQMRQAVLPLASAR